MEHTQVTTQATGSPSDFLSATAFGPAVACNIGEYEVPGQPGPECQPYYKYLAVSSVLGTIASGAGALNDLLNYKLKTEFAFTRTSWTGTVFNPCTPEKCEFQVINFCTDATTPPDLDMNDLNIGDMPVNFPPVPGNPPYYWDVYGPCFQFASSPWLCTHAFAVRYATPVPLGICTHNPPN